MLLEINPMIRNTVLTISFLACALSGAYAQAPATPATDKPDLTLASPYLDPAKLDPKGLAEAKESGELMVRDILNSYNTLRTPEMEQSVLALKRKVDDIADATMAGERDKILEFLGVDPQGETGLYYFVSWSMPLEILRSYAVEAMWSGGSVVFKGVPPGKELGKFIINDLRELVYGKGAAANISIDPRLFDAYAVKSVPAIVFTTVKANMQCLGSNPVSVTVDEVTGAYDTCPELDPSAYWKISGAVTSHYALNAFVENGAEHAKLYVNALAKGFRNGAPADSKQKPFAGKWEEVISPSELLAAQEAAGLMTTPIKQAQPQ
jgi:type-F conjugative transfer system pilin assembly protein TrbC